MCELALKNKKPLYLPLIEYNALSFVVPSGTNSYTSEVLLNSLPTFAAFCIVSSKAYFGNYSLNPFNFQRHGLNGFRLTLNNEDLLFNNARISANEYVRFYNQLLCIRNDNNQMACDLSASDFLNNGYAIYPVWNSLNGKKDRVPLQTEGSVRLTVNFAAPTSESLSVIFYYESAKRIELDGNSVFIKTDFNEDK